MLVFKGLETVVSVLFRNNARAECTMNEKFSILQEATGTDFGTENFEFILHPASALFVN